MKDRRMVEKQEERWKEEWWKEESNDKRWMMERRIKWQKMNNGKKNGRKTNKNDSKTKEE